jgi:hypothetical protein
VKPEFRDSFDAARTTSTTEAANLLRKQGAFLPRVQRAEMLNLIVHQSLRQKGASSLDDLRRLHADWHAIGPGAGLDPLLAMELEAAQAAAERELLTDALKLIAASRFAEAESKLAALVAPRYLPVAVVQLLPGLRAELKRAVPFVEMKARIAANAPFDDVWRPVADVAREQLTPALVNTAAVWSALDGAREMLNDNALFASEDVERVLKNVKAAAGPEVANKLRPELAARLFLRGRPADAEKLLEGEVDQFHAAAVLADLRAGVLGRGEIATPQIAAFFPSDGKAPAQSVAILPPEQLAKWKPPARKSGDTTINAAIADARAKLKAIVEAEAGAATGKVLASADRIRAALAADAAPMKVFLDKLEAVRGKPFASPAERQLAIAAATRGLTVAEVIGVLAAEGDRPVVAVRVLANVPAFTTPVALAAGVELSGRPPDAFKQHDDAGFKLTAVRARARVRDAVSFVLNARAAKLAAGQMLDPPDRAALEAEVAKRLGVEANAIPPEEYAQAILDTCRDWADDFDRLTAQWNELDQIVADLERGEFDPDDGDAKDLFALAKTRRIAVQLDTKRRQAGVKTGCELLGAYGPAALPARDWLREQGDGKPWRAEAATALEKVGAK